MKTLHRWFVGGAAALLLATATHPASAQEASPTYSGDLLERSTLTGDWGGLRNDLANKGLTFELGITQVEQGVVSGGKGDHTWDYGSRGDLKIVLDTGKAGLWPGGFLTLEAEGAWGDGVNGKTGAMMAADTNQLFPTPARSQFGLPALNFMQFFSHYFGIVLGKMDTMDGADANEFAPGGKGDDHFMNLALAINPTLVVAVPYSTLSFGAVVLPTGDPKQAVVTAAVMSGRGKATTAGFDDIEADEFVYAAEGRVRTPLFGLTGHQLLGGVYATRNFAGLDQRLGDLLIGTPQTQNDSWVVYYNFDQYLYEPEKGSGKGLGLFGRFGTTDGDANPMHYMCSIGLGGNGIVPGREDDNFGLGYYFLDISRPTLMGPVNSRQLLGDEHGFEAYYNIALTPWLRLTPDLQVILPAQERHLVGPPPPAGPVVLGDVDTAVVLGLRLKVLF